MEAPTVPRSEPLEGRPAEKVSGARPSRIPGLSKLPDKRPKRRFPLIHGLRQR